MAAIDIIGSAITVLSVVVPVISALVIASIAGFMMYAVYDLARAWVVDKAFVQPAALNTPTKLA
jgi:uncharacterized membrane-anchored protein